VIIYPMRKRVYGKGRCEGRPKDDRPKSRWAGRGNVGFDQRYNLVAGRFMAV